MQNTCFSTYASASLVAVSDHISDTSRWHEVKLRVVNRYLLPSDDIENMFENFQDLFSYFDAFVVSSR